MLYCYIIQLRIQYQIWFLDSCFISLIFKRKLSRTNTQTIVHVLLNNYRKSQLITHKARRERERTIKRYQYSLLFSIIPTFENIAGQRWSQSLQCVYVCTHQQQQGVHPVRWSGGVVLFLRIMGPSDDPVLGLDCERRSSSSSR